MKEAPETKTWKALDTKMPPDVIITYEAQKPPDLITHIPPDIGNICQVPGPADDVFKCTIPEGTSLCISEQSRPPDVGNPDKCTSCAYKHVATNIGTTLSIHQKEMPPEFTSNINQQHNLHRACLITTNKADIAHIPQYGEEIRSQEACKEASYQITNVYIYKLYLFILHN